MGVKTEMIDITSKNGTFKGYFAAPEGGGPMPGVVVIQEIFGVNSHVRDVTSRMAEAGYAALAPDLFWPVEHGFETGYTPSDLDKARAARAEVDTDKAVEDVGATIAALKGRAECNGKIGVVGFCWGGLITYLTHVRHNPDCSSAYYGGGIVSYLGEVDNIKTPIIFNFGTADASIPMDQVEQIKAAVQGKSATVYTYDGAQHGFNCDQRPSYHAEHAAVAWQRTLDFFGQHLR